MENYIPLPLYHHTLYHIPSSLASLRGGTAPARQITRSIDKADMRKGLREVAEQAALLGIVLFRQQSHIVSCLQQSLKEPFGFLLPAE